MRAESPIGTPLGLPTEPSGLRTMVADHVVSDAPTALSKIVAGTPDGPWREVARWRDLGLATTEEFTVSGPWRIRWSLQFDDEPFVVMVEEGEKAPLLLNGGVGVTEGAFYFAPAGTFALAFHTQTPWEVVVEDLGFGEIATP